MAVESTLYETGNTGCFAVIATIDEYSTKSSLKTSCGFSLVDQYIPAKSAGEWEIGDVSWHVPLFSFTEEKTHP